MPKSKGASSTPTAEPILVCGDLPEDYERQLKALYDAQKPEPPKPPERLPLFPDD